MMKARFADHASANTIKEKAIFLFKLYITPGQIEFEHFTPGKHCVNCYPYGRLKYSCKEEKTQYSECDSATYTAPAAPAW